MAAAGQGRMQLLEIVNLALADSLAAGVLQPSDVQVISHTKTLAAARHWRVLKTRLGLSQRFCRCVERGFSHLLSKNSTAFGPYLHSLLVAYAAWADPPQYALLQEVS